MIISAGYGASGVLNAWCLPLSPLGSWQELDVEDAAPGRFGQVAGLDEQRDRIVMFGGYYVRNDTWLLELSGNPTWSELNPSPPLPAGRTNAAAIYDQLRDRLVVFGGDGSSAGNYNDTWFLRFDVPEPKWEPLAVVNPPPSPRNSHTTVYDPIRDQMLVYGGTPSTGDVWALQFSTDPPSWMQWFAGGTPPPNLWGHTALWDPIGKRMLVLGGWPNAFEVWALEMADESYWRQIRTDNPPPRTYFSSSVYDARNDRVVVFGGARGKSVLSDET